LCHCLPLGPAAAVVKELVPFVFHAFGFQWKPEATDAQKERADHQIAALQGRVPGPLQTHVGPILRLAAEATPSWELFQFKDRASLEAYPQHPAHLALLAWLAPLIDAVELDLAKN